MGGDPRDHTWFRQVLGQYPTGVAVVTGRSEEGPPTGLVVGSFTSVSLEPPLVAFFAAKSSTSWPRIAARRCFCVNVLAEDQGELCRRFTVSGGDKFAGISWRAAPTGSPIIEDVVAWIDCELESVTDAGDHVIAVGRVRELAHERPAEPLLFVRGAYGRFSPLALDAFTP